jgi:hypothetical protein
MNGGSRRFILIEVEVSDPEPFEGNPDLYQTRLTNANLAGALVLAHGKDRDTFLRTITVDEKEINPVQVLFENLRAMSQRHS